MANYDNYLAALEDRYAKRLLRPDIDKEADETAATVCCCALCRSLRGNKARTHQHDEHGRPPSHPDHGYRGESVSVCPCCRWRGDPFGSEFCPDCHEVLEPQS